MQLKAKKRFGQNFISDKNLINKIVNLLGEETDHLIIEIGPGSGALTKLLSEKYKKVIAIEIDSDMQNILHEKVTNSNFELIIADALMIDLEKIITKEKYQQVSLISNTPYYITGAILFKTLKVSKLLNKAVFMLQKEVAQRICANKNENNYNNLSIACEFYATRKYEFTVNKNMFKPIPKVDSAIISLTFNKNNFLRVADDKSFVEFLRKIFNNRRKNILNNLSNLTLSKIEAQNILTEIQIETNLRPENLSLEDFINIYNCLNTKAK